MWRTELWHPFIVHAPIALLLVGTGMRLVGAFHQRYPRLQFFVPGGRVVLVLGTVGAWAAVYTGTLADAEVARSLCDPTVAEAHEYWAYRVAFLFSIGLALDGLLWGATRWVYGWRQSALLLVMSVCLLAGSGALGYVGHLGARLVYQQGAAVHHPGPDCAAFE